MYFVLVHKKKNCQTFSLSVEPYLFCLPSARGFSIHWGSMFIGTKFHSVLHYTLYLILDTILQKILFITLSPIQTIFLNVTFSIPCNMLLDIIL